MGPQFDREFMLNTALRTSLRDYDSIVGYVFLDVCYVLQFYREELAEPISHNNSLIILDHPWSSLYIFVYFGLFWNHLETWISFVYHLYIICISGFHQLSVDLCCFATLCCLVRFCAENGPEDFDPKTGRYTTKTQRERGAPKGRKEDTTGDAKWKMMKNVTFIYKL